MTKHRINVLSVVDGSLEPSPIGNILCLTNAVERNKRMKKFKIRIEEKLRRFVEVEAENYQDAEDELQRKYRNSEIVLDSGDFAGVTFSLEGVEYDNQN